MDSNFFLSLLHPSGSFLSFSAGEVGQSLHNTASSLLFTKSNPAECSALLSCSHSLPHSCDTHTCTHTTEISDSQTLAVSCGQGEGFQSLAREPAELVFSISCWLLFPFNIFHLFFFQNLHTDPPTFGPN